MRRGCLKSAVSMLIILMPVSANAQWSHLGLSGRQASQLRSRDGFLYACTDDGLHRKVSDSPDSSWTPLGFAGQTVHDLLAVTPETLIVARDITTVGADTVALWRSTDGGASWSPFQNGFGADGSQPERKVVALLGLVGSPGTVIGVSSSRICRSTDGGMHWKKVFGGVSFYYFLTAGSGNIWAGGESGVFLPYAYRSTNDGENWSIAFTQPFEAAALSVAFDPSDANVAFIGVDGGIYRSVTGGGPWTLISAPGSYSFRAMGNRAVGPLRLYVNGHPFAPNATILKTDDGGSLWTPISFAGSGSSDIRDMLVRSGPASDTLFLGTARGVIRYVEHEIVGVELPARQSSLQLRAQPNPLHSETTLSFELAEVSSVSLRVLDLGGREVSALLRGERPAGHNQVLWKAGKVRTGAYFLELRANGETAITKVFVVR